ncbi:MAG TPA: TIM-barrel domain-containing protein, partial [Jatrophihabitantaceae bacterium]
MSARISPRPILRRRRIFAAATAVTLVAGLVPAVVAIPAHAIPADAVSAPVPAPAGPTFSQDGGALTLREPSAAGAPGYTISIATSPFRVTTQRGGHTVLATTASGAPQTGPADFTTSTGWATATKVAAQRWHDGVLDLTLATSQAGTTVAYRIAPQSDRYRITWSVDGATATQVGTHYDVASAGHWYGMGEATTPDGGPGTQQPWPLDSGTVHDANMAPAEYLMTDPFWFTQRGTGLWVDTHDVMDVSLNSTTFAYTLTNSATMDSTVFVENTPRDVYADYLGITGPPSKSDATPAQYAKPLWNSWAQYYTTVSQASTLSWAKSLHDAGMPAQAIQVDDGWMSHYGDFTFNEKFPDPKQLSDQVHAMGDDFGLWVTLWINKDAHNYSYAVQHGYLLKSKADPSQPCDVTWWNGVAGIVDLANPDARAWYVGELQKLESTYGVDGFKFDTRFFDESCAPSAGKTPLDYLTLGAQLTDQFDQQGAGVRIHWTGSQKYGFVTRQVDKGTGWDSVQAAVTQNLAISTIGYPFVET